MQLFMYSCIYMYKMASLAIVAATGLQRPWAATYLIFTLSDETLKGQNSAGQGGC